MEEGKREVWYALCLSPDIKRAAVRTKTKQKKQKKNNNKQTSETTSF